MVLCKAEGPWDIIGKLREAFDA